MKPTVTLQTLARVLGVSRTTVSNAFSRPDQLSDECGDGSSRRRPAWVTAAPIRPPGRCDQGEPGPSGWS